MGELYDGGQESVDPQEKDPDRGCDVHWGITGQNSRNCEVVHACIVLCLCLCIISLLVRELTYQIILIFINIFINYSAL